MPSGSCQQEEARVWDRFCYHHRYLSHRRISEGSRRISVALFGAFASIHRTGQPKPSHQNGQEARQSCAELHAEKGRTRAGLELRKRRYTCCCTFLAQFYLLTDFNSTFFSELIEMLNRGERYGVAEGDRRGGSEHRRSPSATTHCSAFRACICRLLARFNLNLSRQSDPAKMKFTSVDQTLSDVAFKFNTQCHRSIATECGQQDRRSANPNHHQTEFASFARSVELLNAC
jgi:hypothetical protein